MENAQAFNQLQVVERQVIVLINELKQLKEENKLLKAENKTLKEASSQKNEQLAHFQNQIKITSIVDNLLEEGNGSDELKSKIDHFIKEIDACITHLSE